MNRKNTILLIAVTSFLFATPTTVLANGAVYDVYPGSTTIQQTRDAIRAVNTNMAGDIIVNLHGGTYRLNETIVFDQRDSGTNNYKIIYRAAPGEKPIISGGTPVTGWTLVGNGIYKASVSGLPEFRQLYVNGSFATRAREPDTGFYRVSSWDKANKLINVKSSEISNWARFDEAEMTILRNWMGTKSRLSSFSTSGATASIVLQEPDRTMILGDKRDHFFYNNPFYFEDAYELLDTEGEWYLNTATNEVFYKPRAGETISTAEIVAPKLENLIKVIGTLDNQAHHIQFQGITFQETTWLRPNTDYVRGEQSTDFADKTPGAIHLENANNILLERNVFKNLGGNGIDLYSGASDNTIRGNLIKDTASGGIIVDQVWIDNSTDSRIILRRNKVANNYITRIGRELHSASGITIGVTDGTIVEHNELYDMPYTGISLWAYFNKDNTQFKNSIVRYNRIHKVMNLLDDGAGIYAGNRQPGTQIYENYIYDITRSSWASNLTLAGIYLDWWSSFMTFKNNVVENAPLGLMLHESNNNTFVNWSGTKSEWSTLLGKEINPSESTNAFTTDNTFSPTAVKANAGLEAAYADILQEAPANPSASAQGSDTSAPTVRITAPAFGATVSESVTIKAGASDDTGIASVQFLIDATILATDTVPDNGINAYSAVWDTIGVKDGKYVISVIAKDTSGNVSNPASVSITVDNDAIPGCRWSECYKNSPPTVSITSPRTYAADPAGKEKSIEIIVLPFDTGGVKKVEFYLGSNAEKYLGSDDSPSCTDSAYCGATFSFTLGLAAGSHTITATAYDDQNASASTAAVITIGAGASPPGQSQPPGTSAAPQCTDPAQKDIALKNITAPCPVLSVSAQGGTGAPVTISLAVQPRQYVYDTVFISDSAGPKIKKWTPQTLPSCGRDGWCTISDGAVHTLTLNAGDISRLGGTGARYVASWDWTWNGECWLGPGSSACDIPGKWRIQKFGTAGASAPPPAVTTVTTVTTVTPASGSTLAGSTQTFTWNSVDRASGYVIWLGSTEGAKDIYATNTSDKPSGISATSDTATKIPTDGRTLYLSVWWLIGNEWSHKNFTYKASGTGVGGADSSVTNVAPTITTHPSNQSVTAGQTATFSVVAGGTAPLTYQWQKNGTNISGATNSSYTTGVTASSDTNAAFRVVVTNAQGSVTSNPATLSVSTSGVGGAGTGESKYQLTIFMVGSGSGSVFGSFNNGSDSFSCLSSCQGTFNAGMLMNITASPTNGSTFAGWSGSGCSGTGSCAITLNSDTTITAAFNPASSPTP